MDAEANALLFGDRRDDADPVFEVGPHLVFGVHAVVRQRHLLGQRVVEGGSHRAAADGTGGVRQTCDGIQL